MALKQKLFYETFGLLMKYVREYVGLTSKEKLYDSIFSGTYDYVGMPLYSYDGIRKITSGQELIHIAVRNRLHTYEGFENFRKQISEVVDAKNNELVNLINSCINILENNKNMPKKFTVKLRESLEEKNEYSISRSIAAILIASADSDSISKKKQHIEFDYNFMRLTEEEELLGYPSYLTEMPKASTESFVGREEELAWLKKQLLETAEGKHIYISAVGGLGKTELVKCFLKTVCSCPVDICGVEKIAWITYNNNDIIESIKNSFHMTCDYNEVWMNLQGICEKYGNRLLLVVDNIEKNDDEYLARLSNLPCNIIVTTRLREMPGFKNHRCLEPLSMEKCRELFYYYYQFDERNDETVADIIHLTAKLTIMIVFISKAAYLEGLSINELYVNLVEKGFHLSEEEVACEHERVNEQDTIINQMCILFSLLKYNELDKIVLTDISIIPGLQFDFCDAKRWFGIAKNSMLMKLYRMGMLEHVTDKKKHIYWMHSVIAAAIRAQQKEKLYDLSRPFVKIMTEELDITTNNSEGYEKAYLIPFSWSIADIMETMWNDEDDIEFLLNLFRVSYMCSNFRLCEKIIELVLKIEKCETDIFGATHIAYAYREKIDLLLQLNRLTEAEKIFNIIEKMYRDKILEGDIKEQFSYQLANYYQMLGDYDKARKFLEYIIEYTKEDYKETGNFELLARGYSELGQLLISSGNLFEAENYLRNALALYDNRADDSYAIIICSYLASLFTELINEGYGTIYLDEALECYEKVINFREEHLGMHHVDTAVIYHEYAGLWYNIAADDEGRCKALDYCKRAQKIYEELFGKYSIALLQSKNLEALILWDAGKLNESAKLFELIIDDITKRGEKFVVDKADYLLNYAGNLIEVALDDSENGLNDVEYRAKGFLYSQKKAYEKGKALYKEVIEIMENFSTTENPKLARAYQEYADLLFRERKTSEALEHFMKSKENIIDDFYRYVDVVDKIAACNIILGKFEIGVEVLDTLVGILVEYDVNDKETKFTLCNSLSAILAPGNDTEIKCNQMLMEQIKSNEGKINYVEHFFDNFSEN